MTNTKPQLFQYAIIWDPTEKQIKEEGLKSKVLVDLKTVLATDANTASIMAGMDIPADYRDQVDQIRIALRPF
jgi:hypothetical protein